MRSWGGRAAASPNVRIVRRGEPIFTQRKSLKLAFTDIEAREGVRAFALIPLRYDGEIIGCLIAGSHTIDDVPQVSRLMLETIAVQMGGAVARLRMEERLRLSERSYRQLFDASSVMIFVYDPVSGAIDDVNEEALKVLGYTKDEVRNLDIAALSLNEHPFTQQEAERLIRKAGVSGPDHR